MYVLMKNFNVSYWLQNNETNYIVGGNISLNTDIKNR